jgi:hypothetical protein
MRREDATKKAPTNQSSVRPVRASLIEGHLDEVMKISI